MTQNIEYNQLMMNVTTGIRIMSLLALIKSPATFSISTDRITLFPQNADSEIVTIHTAVRIIPINKKTLGKEFSDLVYGYKTL